MPASTDRRSRAPLLAPSAALERFRRPVDELVGRAAHAEHTLRYGYRVGAWNLLIGERVASEVVRAERIVAIPRTPRWLLGMTNLRGRPVPVFDLRAALSEATGEGARGRFVLVLDKGERAVGIEVDDYPSALRSLRGTDAVPPLPARLAPFVAGAATERDALWLEFDHRGFFEALRGEPDDRSVKATHALNAAHPEDREVQV